MNNPNLQLAASEHTGQDAFASTLHSVFRFLRTVRLRAGILVACLIVACILGAAHYSTAPRIFESKASLYIMQMANAGSDLPGGTDPSKQMATFRKLVTEQAVLALAYDRISDKYKDECFGDMDRDQALETIADSLSVSYEFNTNVLDFKYRSESPKASAAILIAVLHGYEKFLDTAYDKSSTQKLEGLEQQLESLKQERLDKFAQLQRVMMATPDLVGTGTSSDTISLTVQKIQGLMAQQAEARLALQQSRMLAHGLLKAIQEKRDIFRFAEQLGLPLLERASGLSGAESFATVRKEEELSTLRARLSVARQSLGDKNPEIQELTDQIRLIENDLSTQTQQSIAKFKSHSREVLEPQLIQLAQQRYSDALQAEKTATEEIKAERLNAQGLTLKIFEKIQLESEMAQLDRAIERQDEKIYNIEANSKKMISTEIGAHPSIPKAPVSPKLVVIGFLSIFLGTAAGLGIIWVLDIMDDRFRAPEELKLQLNTQILTMVPAMEPTGGESFDAVTCHARPNSRESESFRNLRTNLEFANGDTNRIVCTSTEPGDGKTTISSNMAVTFAQSGRKTLVIDADMRKPGLSTLLQMRDDYGLSVILRSQDELDEAVKANLRSTDVNGLDVISSGPRPTNPAELLASERFANLLAWAETRYDQIIVDAPPVLAVSDPLIIGRLVDGVVLVVRPDKDRRRMVIRAAEALHSVRCNLLGIVVNHLNGTDADGFGYGYGYGYGYGETDDPITEQPVKSSKSDLATLPFPEDDTSDRHSETAAKFAAIGSGADESKKAA